MFLEFWKLVKPKEIPRKAWAQSGVSLIFEALSWHDDGKENIPLFYFEIKSKKLQDTSSLAYNILYDNSILLLTPKWLNLEICLII